MDINKYLDLLARIVESNLEFKYLKNGSYEDLTEDEKAVFYNDRELFNEFARCNNVRTAPVN